MYRITGQAGSKTIFPLAHYQTKQQVRADAAQRGLVTARKRDSQGICFVGTVGIKDFLSQYVETAPGNVIEQETGKVLGRHDGAIFYTFGQRHGLNVGGGLPYYVVGKNMERNEVYVSRNLNAAGFFKDEILLHMVHWINDTPRPDKKYQIRVRHRAPLVPASLQYVGDGLLIKPDEPERAVAAGQSIVIYDGQECLGGGIVR